MKKIVPLIVLLVVFFIALNTAEVLVAQPLDSGAEVFRRQMQQIDQQQRATHQAEVQEKAIIVAVCAAVAIGGFLLFLYALFVQGQANAKKRDEEQRKWLEERDKELRENRSSDKSDK